MAIIQSIERAKQILDAVKRKPLPFVELQEIAIELTGLMLDESQKWQTQKEKNLQAELARMMKDPVGKLFTTVVADQCFRSKIPSRITDQLVYTLQNFGIPKYLSTKKRIGLYFLKHFGNRFPSFFAYWVKRKLRQEASLVIISEEKDLLKKHLKKRYKEGTRINLNHLGEAILGEKEAFERLQLYLTDLKNPDIEYVSIKISTICSQLNLLAWEDTVDQLVERLTIIYRAAKENKFLRPNGVLSEKFVNLDMEEYRDLHLTVAAFCKTLSKPEFLNYSAGIVLQSYIPDSFTIQKELTDWAKERLSNQGAPIKIRIVKGANLAMEKVEASLHHWPQAPYLTKIEADANYKRMLLYASQPENAKAVMIGVASHNLFDIALALLLRAQNNIESKISFEMLEGMADHIRRVVQTIADDMLLYCPVASEEEFQNAIAYLVRRLDENTAQGNFLRDLFGLRSQSKKFQEQADLFIAACNSIETTSFRPRRTQDRTLPVIQPERYAAFDNEPNSDWSLPQNIRFAENIIAHSINNKIAPIPLVIGGEIIECKENSAIGRDPSNPNHEFYRYSLANADQVDLALSSAFEAQKEWSQTTIAKRSNTLAIIARKLRESREKLISVMIGDTAKSIPEADAEISEAIDFAEYYRRNMEEWHNLPGITWKQKGTVLVASPWNFPCAIAAGGIIAALATGNCVIFKPATEAVLVGFELAKIFWDAGINKKTLQFLTCADEPIGSMLIKDPRIDAVILTGATSTAELFLNMRPSLDLIAETGGKNSLIITGLSDRDLAIKDLISSAFGYSGQKCSACSLAILEAEVYDDPAFLKHLEDAASSLSVGSAWNLKSKITPLIAPPNETLNRGLKQLDPGETWLLEPKQDPENPHLWSPGIKLGVIQGSFSHQNEFFGPVLSVMRADNLEHAIKLANGTPYGLTSGLHSLDQREKEIWSKTIEAGNCYINRGITGAIVRRQPFGGCKGSSFGKGLKAGGPNYLSQLMHAEQSALSHEKSKLKPPVEQIAALIKNLNFSNEHLELWEISAANYAFYWNHYFNKERDPSLLIGEDNILRYRPHAKMTLKAESGNDFVDLLRIITAAATVHCPLEVSGSEECVKSLMTLKWPQDLNLHFAVENEEKFQNRVLGKEIERLRMISKPNTKLQDAIARSSTRLHQAPVLASGRIELLHYLREISFSISYHRYGYLCEREKEKRSQIKNSLERL